MRGLTSRCETWERGSEWLPLTYLADIPSTWAHIVTLVIDAGGHGVTPVVMGTPHGGLRVHPAAAPRQRDQRRCADLLRRRHASLDRRRGQRHPSRNDD